MKLPEKLYERILSNARGGYLGLSWAVTDAKGERAEQLRPGGYVVAENYYGYVVLRAGDDMQLTECEQEES
jgi:hypothetical protein